MIQRDYDMTLGEIQQGFDKRAIRLFLHRRVCEPIICYCVCMSVRSMDIECMPYQKKQYLQLIIQDCYRKSSGWYHDIKLGTVLTSLNKYQNQKESNSKLDKTGHHPLPNNYSDSFTAIIVHYSYSLIRILTSELCRSILSRVDVG